MTLTQGSLAAWIPGELSWLNSSDSGTGYIRSQPAIDLELKYNYYSGGQLTSAASVQKVLLPVKGGTATGQPVLLIDRGPMGPVSPGQPFQITLKLENTDTVKRNTESYSYLEPNDQISLLEATDTRQIGDIGPGQSVDVSQNP